MLNRLYRDQCRGRHRGSEKNKSPLNPSHQPFLLWSGKGPCEKRETFLPGFGGRAPCQQSLRPDPSAPLHRLGPLFASGDGLGVHDRPEQLRAKLHRRQGAAERTEASRIHRLARPTRRERTPTTDYVGRGRSNQWNRDRGAKPAARIQNAPHGTEGCATSGIARLKRSPSSYFGRPFLYGANGNELISTIEGLADVYSSEGMFSAAEPLYPVCCHCGRAS
jgi:hypothetical protein